MFEGLLSLQPSTISRRFSLPRPLKTRKLRLEVVEAEVEAEMTLDLMGMTSKEQYAMHKYLEEAKFDYGTIL